MNKLIMTLYISLVLLLFGTATARAEPEWSDDGDISDSIVAEHNSSDDGSTADSEWSASELSSNDDVDVADSTADEDDDPDSNDFPVKRAATGVSVFIFDPHIRQWAVYDANGFLIKTGRGSGGRNYCPDIHRRCRTPVGTFQIYAKQGSGCKSKKFPIGRGGAPMPYCSYFLNGFAIHGSYDVRSYNASHGCIRIYPKDAKWLQTVLPIGSTVIIRPY